MNIVDDPANARVFKGPGHFAATRAESAIRKLQSAFPQLLFEIDFDRRLEKLRATAVVGTPISSNDFIAALTQALAETGTRMAPVERYRYGVARPVGSPA